MNPRRLNPLLWLVLFVLLATPARTCGPDWPQAVFVKQHAPDAPYEAFARGRLGVPQPGYRTRHLVVVYRYLNGLPLSAAEQTAAVRANQKLNSNWVSEQQNPLIDHSGFLAWVDSRKAFGPVDGFLPANPFGTENSWQMDAYFERCLDDAFANASRTLQARTASHGPHSAELVEWVRGQDTVFHNCSGQAASPAVLPAASPQWLTEDRAYQRAAALFYQRSHDAALHAFAAISADSRSPWSPLSRYLIGRIMVERAIAHETYAPLLNPGPHDQPPPEQRVKLYLTQLTEARTTLQAMRTEPRMQPFAHAIDSLIDRVNARLEPELQQRTLALRLTADDPNFYQDTIDLNLLQGGSAYVDDEALINRPKHTPPPAANEAEQRADDLLTWLNAFQGADEAPILQHWRSSPSKPWLIAALTFAKPSDPAVPGLLQAAAQIQPNDPAYAAATYHRLRLSPLTAQTRRDLLSVVPQISPEASASTRNLFAALNAQSSPDLKTWLTQAARKPAADPVFNEEEPFSTDPAAQPCGPNLLPAETPLFAGDVATVLNTRLPLRLLAQAAESSTLPPHLRFQVAQAAWTRALLLNRRDIALRLAPVLVHCDARWLAVLNDYRKAVSPEDRKAAALFALMRFASTEPNVREGDSRPEGFAAYSYYRDNWWCTTVPRPASPENASGRYDPDLGFAFTPPSHPEVPDPAFLTSKDRAEASREISTLRAIPRASEYLPAQALAWQHAHPHDPRAPELLGQAFRVARNACPGDAEHQLFLTLHREYPTHHWTRRYRSWE